MDMIDDEEVTDDTAGVQRKAPISKDGRDLSKQSFYWRPSYARLDTMRDLVPRFRDFYYEQKMENPDIREKDVMDKFDAAIAPRIFNPWPVTLKKWRRKWDKDIDTQMRERKLRIKEETRMVKLRDDAGNLIVPEYSTLEGAAQSLGAELLNDAMNMIKADQIDEDIYDDDIIIKRRNYALNVFNFISRSVHKKSELKLKEKTDERETAAWLMDIVRVASAGGIAEDDMQMMKDAVQGAINVAVPKVIDAEVSDV